MNIHNLFDLTGQVAIVTGGAGGIGFEISRYLSSAGAKIVIADVNLDGAAESVRQIKSEGGSALALELDQSDESSVVAMIEAVRKEFGRIDILINCAAMQHRELIADTSAELWDRFNAINLKGPFLCLREAAKVMVEDGIQGRIVNVSSLSSQMGMCPGLTPYSVGKSGVNALTRGAALEYGPVGIRVNAVLPGAVPTPSAVATSGVQIPDKLVNRYPPTLGRMGEPMDIAGAVLFLVSEAASWVTGQMLVVDGGFSIE